MTVDESRVAGLQAALDICKLRGARPLAAGVWAFSGPCFHASLEYVLLVYLVCQKSD